MAGGTRRRSLAGLFWLALLGWACGILWLSSLPPDHLPSAAELLWDKINHFLAYALGGWLAAGALRLSRPAAPAVLIVVGAILLISAFGELDELWQEYTPGRSGGDVGDWIADTLGATAGALVSLASFRRLSPR